MATIISIRFNMKFPYLFYFGLFKQYRSRKRKHLKA